MGLFKNRDGAKNESTEDGDVPAEQPAGDHDIDADAGMSGAEMQRLWSDGVLARATITGVRDTGQRRAGNTLLDLDLAVTREDAEPYETTLRLAITGNDADSLSAGSQFNVRVDPQDQTKLTFAA